MTWRTQKGERILEGEEAALYRKLMGFMADAIREEIDDPRNQRQFGVRMFDRLEPLVRLDLLARVSSALLRKTETYPPLTAINECVVGAVFRLLDQLLTIEIESEDDGHEGRFSWRRRVLAVFRQVDDVENFPDVECRDLDEWEILTETLSYRILWDEDFDDADLYLDQSPEKAAYMKRFMSIDNDYFAAAPPSTLESDLPEIVKTIHELYEDRSP